jgi:beta-glucosidase/6-phospho-beta-glucosidase/beta-galactosidase
MDTIRILFELTIPQVIEDWLRDRDYTAWEGRRIMDENFKVADLVFEREEDAVQFKLTFPEVAMSKEEIKITDAKQDWPIDVGAAKARIYDRLADIYSRMYTGKEFAT